MSPVIFSELQASNKKIALATLNSPKTLNALSLTMIELLLEQLLAWQADEEIAMVLIDGAGEKAFCAGGDVVSLYHALKPSHENAQAVLGAENIIDEQTVVASLAHEFFSKEYQLDQLIHQYTKPLLVWGDGYVMGGGIGLFAGASHKVVTETSLLAMPEISIGLYPDVGGSWFLNKMPNNIGLFLALTGAMVNARDALTLGLANYAIKRDLKDLLLADLTDVAWLGAKENFSLLSQLLNGFQQQSSAVFNALPAQVEQHTNTILQLTAFDNISDIYHAILALETEHRWLQAAQDKLKRGSALSAAISYQQLKKCQNLSLAECFVAELNLSLRCCQFREFSEGVRALLVDKDKTPDWAYKTIDHVPTEVVQWFFTSLAKPSSNELAKNNIEESQ
ncbi:Enoyl-CoA hydratase/carnithine racemase [Colwellia chukchiensis]|uniref:3-hydroxyisobutyryl-CoA hydrolase n=1 Tax=Colwellia chukchiensis TaxID=641665 RepID=A0A1H7RRT3_9GAMM|nr:enoyl-CoA hydratase/isomerase family protein [Colwellia chukchiensis]SEL62916.1 Enoyl-CoA hydratase/carnithine racemase [Colwellia chukchiensis]